jgi:2-amino-4-hydroxy-6-hydroxymethyldihydropteridine diphosphokinase
MTLAYVGLGSNLLEPLEQVRAGIDALARLPGTQVMRRSSFYRTAPVGFSEQPDFINAVCEIDTALSAESLMQSLLTIEREQGRVRTVPGGPRTLDLDLLLYGDFAVTTEALTLPHPRLHERAFVLYPLNEIAPDLVVPGRGSVADLMRYCVGQPIERVSIS